VAHWAPAKNDTLEAIAREILHNYRRGRSIIAVDGIRGSGTAEFADALADALREHGTTRDGGPVEVVRASIEAFRHPPEQTDAEGVQSGAPSLPGGYDYEAFRRLLVDPFRSGGGTFVVAPGPAGGGTGSPERRIAAPDALLLVDGVFLHRSEVRGIWNFSLWIQVPRELADERAEGPGTATEAERRNRDRDLYWRDADPRSAATAIVDNTDEEHPRRVFADSC